MDDNIWGVVHAVVCGSSVALPGECRELGCVVVSDRDYLGTCEPTLSPNAQAECQPQGVTSGVMHATRKGGNCAGQPIISRCVSQILFLETTLKMIEFIDVASH